MVVNLTVITQSISSFHLHCFTVNTYVPPPEHNIKPPLNLSIGLELNRSDQRLCNNELFDLNRIGYVIIFLSEAYLHTWLLWLQTWSALSVFLTRRGWKKYFYCVCVSFCCPTRVGSAVIQVDWTSIQDVAAGLTIHCHIWAFNRGMRSLKCSSIKLTNQLMALFIMHQYDLMGHENRSCF